MSLWPDDEKDLLSEFQIRSQENKKIRLQKGRFMPKALELGVLYVSEEYGTAAHLCACGCGAKIRTPLGPTDWHLKDTPEGPSLMPSVGNWQQTCRSHYWITRGSVVPAPAWSADEILAGRAQELVRDRAYYDRIGQPKRKGFLERLLAWLNSLLR